MSPGGRGNDRHGLADLDPSIPGTIERTPPSSARRDAIAISEHAIATTYPDAAVIAAEPSCACWRQPA